jgi:hypothetical protein
MNIYMGKVLFLMLLIMLNLHGFHVELSQFIHAFSKIRTPSTTASVTVISVVYLDKNSLI